MIPPLKFFSLLGTNMRQYHDAAFILACRLPHSHVNTACSFIAGALLHCRYGFIVERRRSRVE